MLIEFDFSKNDLIDFNFAFSNREIKDKSWERIGFILLSIFLFFIGVLSKHFFWSILGFVLFISTIFSYKDLRKKIIRAVKKLEKDSLKTQIGYRKLELLNDVLILSDGFSSISYKLESITSIKNIDRFFVIQIGEINLPIPCNIENLSNFRDSLIKRLPSDKVS